MYSEDVMITGERADDAAKEIAKMFEDEGGFLVVQAIAEIIQRAIDDDFADRVPEHEGP